MSNIPGLEDGPATVGSELEVATTEEEVQEVPAEPVQTMSEVEVLPTPEPTVQPQGALLPAGAAQAPTVVANQTYVMVSTVTTV